MIKIKSEQELLESFRLLDREEVILPQNMTFPFLVKDYLSWEEPSGYRVYLIFNDHRRQVPFGVVFRRDQSKGGSAARMCDWCHSISGSDEVSLLSAAASPKRRVGIQLCRDLSCKNNFQSLGRGERINQIIHRMADFSRQNLF